MSGKIVRIGGGSAYFGDTAIAVPQLLKAFHQHRVTRVLSSDYGEVRGPEVPGRADGFIGAVGVSFLTAV